MFRKITTFRFTNYKKIIFFVLFFLNYFLIFCQSNTYTKTKNNHELKNLYLKLFNHSLTAEEIEKLWVNQYPHPHDTLIYQAKINFESENTILNYYYQVQESLIWAFLGILLLNLLLLGVIIPFFRNKKIIYLTFWFLNMGFFVYFKPYFLFQEWVFLPTHSTLYEDCSFASQNSMELSMPQMAIVLKKNHFWWKIETENGQYWVPEFTLIK